MKRRPPGKPWLVALLLALGSLLAAGGISAQLPANDSEQALAPAGPLAPGGPTFPRAVVAGQTLAPFDLPAGGSVTIEFDVTVAAPVPAGTDFVCNQGSLTGGNFTGPIQTDDPDDASSTADPTCTPVVASPVLAATKTVSDPAPGNADSQAQPGEVLTYTVTVTNTGDEGAANVVIADSAPANTTYNDGSGVIDSSSGATGATVTTNTGSLQVDVTELAGAGGTITVSFTVTVDASVPAGTTQIDNTAQVSATGIAQFDSTTASIPVDAAPDLALTKDDGGASVAPGGTVTYTLTVTNNGDQAATGVEFTDTVPADTTFNAGASTAGWACAPDNSAGSVCTLALAGDVAGGGGTAPVTFAVDVVNLVAAGVTQISNSASVEAANAPTPVNAADTTPVTAAPALALDKDDGGSSTVPGVTVAYTLTVTNNGDQDATGVTFTDTVPANTTFNAGASTAGWACAPDNTAGSTCTLAVAGDLAGGGGMTAATFAVTVIDPVPAGTMQISNSASVDATNAPAANAGDTTPVTAAPALALDKDDGGVSTTPGGTVTYTLTVTNNGDMDATGVEFTDTVPADSTFDAGASTAGWSCADGSPPATVCTLALGSDVAGGGGTDSVDFAVTVDDPVAVGTVITNAASVDAANATMANAGDTTPVVVDTVPPTVVAVDTVPPTGGGLTDGETTTAGITAILVTFSESVQDPPGDTDPDDVTNPANYLLVEAGVNGAIDTVSCAAGLAPDDVAVAIAGVTYDDPSLTATVDLGGPLPLGSYAFFVCGSTSIVDLAGNPLDGGFDFMIAFQVVSIIDIPTLSPLGGALLALLLLALGWWTLRRRGPARRGAGAAMVAIALLAGLGAAGPASAAEVVVDDFGDAQAVSTAGTAANQVDQTAGTILGGERDLEVSLLSGTGPITADVDTTTAGALRFDVPGSGRGRLLASWDGDDDDADLDESGLLGADLTGGAAPLNNALRLTVDAVTGTVEVVVEVFTDAANSSRAAATVTAAGEVLLTFAGNSPDFETHLGTGATFTNVGAVTVELRSTGAGSIDVGDFRAVPPDLGTPLKVDLDTSNNPLASITPGGTVRYRITITNTGGEATAVDVADVIDAATAAVGNLKTTPVAFDDSYVATGNVTLSVPAGTGLLANDGDPDGGAVSVDVANSDTATLQGGTVTYVGTAGAFDYDPPAGFTGVDSFSYQIEDDEVPAQTATATATLLLDGLVWFVDDTHCAAPCGSGTLADPFGSFDPTQLGGAGGAGDLDGPNDIIYVRTGSGTTDTGGANGFELEDGQQLLGEGVDLVVNGQTLVTAGTAPVLTNTAGTPGNGVTVAANNTVRGLTVGDTGGMGFKNAAMATVGTLTISDVTVQGAGGIMNVDGGGTLAVTLANATSTSSATRGISLDGVGGSFTVSGSTTLDATTGTGIHVAGALAGSAFDFGSTAIGQTTASGAGVDLTTSAGATFTFDSLDVTASSGAGLTAATAGTVTIGGVANTITATGGAALDVSSTDVGAGWTFDALTSTNSAGAGVRLDGLTGTGTEVTVTGTTTVDKAAGSAIDLDNAGDYTFGTVSVQNRGGIGIDLDATSGALQFGATTVNNQNAAAADGIQITGSTAGSVSFTSATVDVNNAAANAIDASGNAAPITFTTVNLDDSGADAVLLAGNAGGVMINGGDVDGVSGDGVHSTNTPLTVNLVSFGGTNPITGDGVEIVNSDATSRSVTVQNSNFGLGSALARGIFVNSTGTGTVSADVRFNQIESTNETILTTDGGTAGSLVLDLQNSTLTRTSAGFTERHAGSGLNSTIVRSWGAPNQVTSTTGGGIQFNRVTFDASGTSLSGTQVGYAGTLQIGALASRVQGDGLSFLAPSGSLSIGTLNAFNNAGTGLKVDTKTLGTTFTLATGAGTVNTTGGPALDLDPLAAALTLTSAVSSASTGAGALFDTVSGTVNVPTLDIDGSTGNGLTIRDSSATFTFTTVTVDSAAGAGVFLNNNTGPININGGAVGGTNDPAGNAVDVDGGNANITIAAPVTKNSAGGEVVEVTNRTGGAISFTQAITCNSGCTGMNFASNSGGSTTFSHTTKTVNTGANAAITVASSAGHPINFTNGGLDVDSTTQPAVSVTGGATIDISGGSGTNNTINATTGAGFTASGGGTVVVTGNAIVTTTTGTAVNISGTTIGAGDVTFRSVSATGAVNGILLNATGASGGLTVTGDGATANSGGTISNATGDGISATDTQDLSLSFIRIQNPANHGILATGLRGSCLLQSSIITQFNTASRDGYRVVNNSVNLTELRINGSTFSASDGNDGLAVFAQGTSVIGIVVENQTLFTDLEGDAIDILAGDLAGSTGTVNLSVDDCDFTNAGATGNGGIQVRALQDGTLTGSITNNTFNDTHRLLSTAGVIEIQGNNTGSVDLTVSSNDLDTFGQSGINVVADDASDVTVVVDGNFIDTNVNDRIGIRASIRNTGATRLTIQNNQVGLTTAMPGTTGTRSPIDIEVFDDSGATDDVRILIDNNQLRTNKTSGTSEVLDVYVSDGADAHLTVTNNTLTNVGSGDSAEITLDSPGTPTLCLDLRSNTATNPGPTTGDIELIELAGTYSVEDLSNVVANNPSANIVFDPNMAAFTNSAGCLTP